MENHPSQNRKWNSLIYLLLYKCSHKDPFFTGSMSGSYLNGSGNGNNSLISINAVGGSASFQNQNDDIDYKNTMNADFIQPGKTN
jgi:hypothetical protein